MGFFFEFCFLKSKIHIGSKNADGKQKISLGRGLVRSDVNAIMFDEPLTVIDPHLKWILRSKLKELHQKINRTMIYVTHDQTEALTFADQVVVMHEGQIVQTGTPVDLFEKPKHTNKTRSTNKTIQKHVFCFWFLFNHSDLLCTTAVECIDTYNF